MGNVNVMLRYRESEGDEPKFARVEIGQHIKWAEFRQLAFGSFQGYLGDGADPQLLYFETRLDNSNITVAIPDGDTLRGMFKDFYRMDKGGAPAVIDVLIPQKKVNKAPQDQSSSDQEPSPRGGRAQRSRGRSSARGRSSGRSVNRGGSNNTYIYNYSSTNAQSTSQTATYSNSARGDGRGTRGRTSTRGRKPGRIANQPLND